MKETPAPHWPRGLNRVQAATYVGVSHAIWDRMVAAGDMPPPKRVYGRTIWDRLAVDKAFELLEGGNASTDDGEEHIYEFAAGPPISEWPIETRPLPHLQERALAHMYEHGAGQFFRAEGCGPKTYAALADLGLLEVVGERERGKPAYLLTKIGLKKAKYLRQIGR
ncbi:hypothetical protein [Bradyrhizobium sp. Bra64]|uniref:hypothetical protein n=1 Tax=Bradyrhizobium sp. Bra64 TaxID=2926009 RepID=UPI002119014A|nr:hypothetical protein [Bradyrhizobium sp. Bra64]